MEEIKFKPKLSIEEYSDLLGDIEMLSVMKRNGKLIGINVSSKIIDSEISNKVALIKNAGWHLPEKIQQAKDLEPDEDELDEFLPEVYKRKNIKFSNCRALRDKFIRMDIHEKIADLLKPETWSYIEDPYGQILGKGKKDNSDLRPYDEDDDPENEPIVQALELIEELELEKERKGNSR